MAMFECNVNSNLEKVKEYNVVVSNDRVDLNTDFTKIDFIVCYNVASTVRTPLNLYGGDINYSINPDNAIISVNGGNIQKYSKNNNGNTVHYIVVGR